jgi:ankyrin repeat protein
MAMWDHEMDTWKEELCKIEADMKAKFGGSSQQAKDESSRDSCISPEIVKLLLKAGLKADEKNIQGETPLDLAKRKRNKTLDRNLKSRYDAIVKYLEQAMASSAK